MTKKLIVLAAGTALTVSASPALAQMAPGATGASAPMHHHDQRMPPPSETALMTRDTMTGGYRAARQGDNDLAVISLSDYTRYYQNKFGGSAEQARASFLSKRQESESACTLTGEFIRESIEIAAEAKSIDIELVDLTRILTKLGKQQNAAAGLQVGAQVVGTGLLCALSGGLYCAAAAAGGVSNVLGVGSHWNTQKVDRKMRFISVDQSRVQIRASLLTMRMNIAWAEMVHGYCLTAFPQQTTGVSTVSTSVSYAPASSGGWQNGDTLGR